jgi:hypothetical protein
VTDDPELRDSVVKGLKAGRFELVQSVRDDPTKTPEIRLEHPMRSESQTVHDDVAPAKYGSLVNHLMHRQSDSGVVGANDGSGADADDDVDWNAVSQDPTKHSEVRGAPQASRTENDPDPDAA